MTRDAIVVGAGVVGAAVADALAAEKVRVLVIDRAFRSAGVTSAGMGHVVVMDDSPAQLELTRWSRELLLDQAHDLTRDCELDRCGTFWIAEDAAQLDAARKKLAVCEENGIRAQLIDSAELSRAEPQLRDGLAGALHVPDDVVVYPPGLCAFLLDRAVRNGARVLHGTTVRSISSRSVTTTESVLHADIIVNAAGTWAPRLTPELPVVPRKGHLVITERYPGFCHHQLVELGYMTSAHTLTGESVAFNVQPRLTGQLLIGSSRELVGYDDGINRRIVARMLERAAAFMPALAGLRAVRTWTGFRPATPDKLPLIGESASGVWVAAGHEGLGITTALGTARLLCELILGLETSIDPEPYAPARLMAQA